MAAEPPEEELDALLERATQLVADQAWEDARELVATALERWGEQPTLLCWLGAAAREQGAEGVAYEYFRRCIAAAPAEPVTLALAGEGLAAFDDPDAESTLRLAALTGPDVLLARLNYGAYLSREGFPAEAVAELEAARAIDETDTVVRGELAGAYLRARRREEALAEWGEAVALDPGNGELRALRALLLMEEDAEDAAEEMHRAALDAPEDVEVQLLCALACAAEGWEDEAWNALARAETVATDVEGGVLASVEECLDAGPEAAREFLRGEIAPSALRERLLRSPF
ncbi:MAG: hypothetical protein M3409_04920 [Gemmatimonadota bacterium]|jgi:tetratricopeptide (TPR) repeat protein|nr:hypothetical protein [Gemmatimonadota bacterium]